MSTTNCYTDNIKSQQVLQLSVQILTVLVVIFSIYMSASFWANLAATNLATISFVLIAIFLEMAKIVAGFSIILGVKNNKKILTVIAVAALLMFCAASLIASIGTISEQIKSSKSRSYNTNEQAVQLKNNIEQQQQIIQALLQSQAADVNSGYRARASETLLKIKAEQQQLQQLRIDLDTLKITDTATSRVVVAISNTLPFDLGTIEQGITLILSCLLEFACLFLLFLNYSLAPKIDSQIKSSNNKSTTVKSKRKITQFPITTNDYRALTKQVRNGEILPTQRNLKKALNLGNENIAKIFSAWINDGVLVKEGRGYNLAC